MAQERGTTQRHLHGLIKESLWPRMDEDERYLFFSSVADKFLARPSAQVSQKAIVNALDNLEIPNGDIMRYIVERLKIPTDDSIPVESADGTEVVRLSSMLFLSHQWHARVTRLLQGSKCGKTNWIKHKLKARADAYSPAMVTEAYDKTKLRRSLSAPKSVTQGCSIKAVAYDPVDHLAPVVESDGEFPKIPVGQLDYDTQFLAAFRVCVWIVRRPSNELANGQRSALLL